MFEGPTIDTPQAKTSGVKARPARPKTSLQTAWVFLIVSGIRRKPISQEKEGLVHLVGFIILIIAVLIFSINDVMRLLHGNTFFK